MTPQDYLPLNYLPVALFLLVGLAFGVGTLVVGSVISRLALRPRTAYREKLMAYESGMDPFSDARIPFPLRYYLTAMLFVVFDIEAIFLYPWAVVFKQIGLFGMVEMALFILILLVGYVYAWRKGALEWD